jgi:hypothetical protein
MDPDAQETAKRAELKARLEEVAGRKLNMTDEQLLSGSWPVASSTYLAKHDADDDAWITSERIAFPPPISMDSALLDTGGLSVTGSDGQIVFRLGNPSGGLSASWIQYIQRTGKSCRDASGYESTLHDHESQVYLR